MQAGGLALNLRLSSLEPALDEQEQTDMIHSCLHSVMAVLPEPEGEDGTQEVSLRVPRRRPHPWGGAEERLLWAVGSPVGPAPHLLPVPIPGHHARP